MIHCDDTRTGMGGIGFMLLAIFLIILFAFWGNRGHGVGGECGHGFGGHRFGPADLTAMNLINNSVPQFEANNWKQAAFNFGETVASINQGNAALSKQISDTASAAEIGALRDRLYLAEAKLLQQETIKEVNEKFCATQASIADIRCNMLQRPQVQALAGLPHLACTNAAGLNSALGGLGGCCS